MNMSYAGNSGRAYSILFMYDIMNGRRYARERTVRSWADGPFAGKSIWRA